MKVSFLVTYYNQKDYVKESIESILKIDKSCEWEILIGDDGSTDGTIEVIKEYQKKYPHNISIYVMQRDKNRKYDSVKRASANRLNLLSHATGDFFCTLDGDDFYFDTEFIKDAMKIFEEHTDVTVVAFGYRMYTSGKYGDEQILSLQNRNFYVNRRNYLQSCYVPAGACVHKRCYGKERVEYIKNIGFFDDNDIVINSLKYGEMYAFDRAIYAYRQTGNSVYTSMSKIEQAVLNVQGFDVDLKLISQEFHKDLICRYANSIITMYIWRRKLKKVLKKDKFDRYLLECKNIQDSIAYKMLSYESLSKKEIKQLRSVVYTACCLYKGISVKIIIKNVLLRMFIR